MRLLFAPMPAARRDALREALLGTVSLLKRCRASEIDGNDIDDYVSLNWMEWRGGSLKLTATGENVCKHLTASLGRNTGQPAARMP